MRRLFRHPAFTLMELLVVIAVFVLLMLIAVPAFSSMLYSTEQSTADNALRVGLSASRDAAIRLGPGRDAAAVFVWENRRVSILACERVGTLDDLDATGTQTITREVFAPVPGFEPVRLPKGWTVRGYATPNTIDAQWYERTYPSNNDRQRGNWLFPENDFYQKYVGNAGANRQTFMIRFEGGTGLLKRDTASVLVYYPSESATFRNTTPWSSPYNADDEPDGVKFATRVLRAPADNAADALNAAERRQILGDEATDTVMAKGVGQVALCNESKLAAALGVRLDSTTQALYMPPAYNQAVPWSPQFIAGTPVNFNDQINQWIENRYPPPPATAVESDSRIYTVHRYLGTLQEVTGTVNGQGVSQ